MMEVSSMLRSIPELIVERDQLLTEISRLTSITSTRIPLTEKQIAIGYCQADMDGMISAFKAGVKFAESRHLLQLEKDKTKSIDITPNSAILYTLYFSQQQTTNWKQHD